MFVFVKLVWEKLGSKQNSKNYKIQQNKWVKR
jgi:hypothetical protein